MNEDEKYKHLEHCAEMEAEQAVEEEKNGLGLTLESEYGRVARLRKESTTLFERKKRLTEEFENQNKELFDDIIRYRDLVSSAEDNLRTLAEDEYVATGKKSLFGGVGIRIKKSLEYDDKRALEWATEHNMCLNLDKRAFEGVMKVQKEMPDFVKLNEVIQPTIPTKMEE